MAASIPGVQIFSWKSACVMCFNVQNSNFRVAPESERTGFVLLDTLVLLHDFEHLRFHPEIGDEEISFDIWISSFRNNLLKFIPLWLKNSSWNPKIQIPCSFLLHLTPCLLDPRGVKVVEIRIDSKNYIIWNVHEGKYPCVRLSLSQLTRVTWLPDGELNPSLPYIFNFKGCIKLIFDMLLLFLIILHENLSVCSFVLPFLKYGQGAFSLTPFPALRCNSFFLCRVTHQPHHLHALILWKIWKLENKRSYLQLKIGIHIIWNL